VVFDYACVRDILYQNGIYIFPWTRGTIAEISLLLFVFFQTTAMSLDTMSEMNEARAKEQRLLAEHAALNRMNTLRTDLMDTLSHELRTPLAVMMGFAELAAKELRLKGLDRDTTADLDSIASEAQRLANMVSEMRQLSLSRDAAEHKSEFFVRPVIEQTTRLFAPILERRETRLSVSLEENLPALFGSPDELTQIMFNLLANAWKHTQNGEVRVSVQMKNGEIEVSVSDTGTGISPEFLPHAFERYAHESEGGTGLGLSLCREIVKSYEGEILLASEPGKGTTVTFTLPVHTDNS
jgi:signal transduction histidine kinase